MCSLSLSVVFWETSVPWEWSPEINQCAGWSTEEKRWGRGPSKLGPPWKPQRQKQGKPEARDAGANCGLHAYYPELVSVDLELWMVSVAILISSTTFDSSCLYQSPFWSFALDLWYYGLVLLSVVAECNVYNNYIFCCLGRREKNSMCWFTWDRDFPGGSVVKNPLASAGNWGSVPGSGRVPGEGNGNRLRYCCLENPMDKGAWRTTVHGSQRVRHDWACVSYIRCLPQITTTWDCACNIRKNWVMK